MKRVWIGVICFWVSQSHADVVLELSLCDALVEPTERLQCFNKVAYKYSTHSNRTLPSQRKQADAVWDRTAELSSSSQNEDAAHVSGSVQLPSVTEQPGRAWATNRLEAPSKRYQLGKDPAGEMHATIVAVQRLSAGQFLLTLANGQVWQEIEPRRRTRYTIDDGVIISKGFGGSFNIKSKVTGYRNKVRQMQ